MTDNPVSTVEISEELAKDAYSALMIASEEFPQETRIRGERMTFEDIADWLDTEIERGQVDQSDE